LLHSHGILHLLQNAVAVWQTQFIKWWILKAQGLPGLLLIMRSS